ncbi:hypothetical protein FNV43_RR00668 [Rhamnella rubrinervis]|uniref:Protein kinase domain-containing protein n=1 Tax=Rhamnella rubrinervis TaxID=2594499 RepID=A0A8K0HP27_9ROSA|nr:hypothetical protein FNV43_RR00668 [Rhamnella rubrinervis]
MNHLPEARKDITLISPYAILKIAQPHVKGRHKKLKEICNDKSSYYAKQAAPKETKTVIAVSDISVDELKDITDNFGTKALIGEGSYGRVYYGVLKSGPAVAIKKLDSSKQPEQEFLAQVLSIMIDVGTNNEKLLKDPLFAGPLGVVTAQGKPMIDFLEQNIVVIGAGRFIYVPLISWS